MSALPNHLISTAFFSRELLQTQTYIDQKATETSRSFRPKAFQDSFFSTIRNSTSSISEFIHGEDDLSPYECSRLSGALSFWDDPGEDIYTLHDGQPL